MIQTKVSLDDHFQVVTAAVRRKSLQALEDAAQAGARDATEHARTEAGHTVSTFRVVHPRADGTGYVSGIKANNRLLNIFDKGSLGKRTAPLKQAGRRKPFWQVNRGTNPYTARRGDTAGEGIAPLNVKTRARAAGRRALIAALRR